MTDSRPRERFEKLVRDHARQMASAIRRVCGRQHRSLIPDVEQEVYLALWKRLQGGKEIEFPASYLYKVALTTALSVVRRVGREVPMPENVDGAGSGNPEAEVSRLSPAERSAILRQTLERLDTEEARALRAYLAGFNHAEVAALYGWSESVARHRIYRTLRRLRAAADETTRRDG